MVCKVEKTSKGDEAKSYLLKNELVLTVLVWLQYIQKKCLNRVMKFKNN